MSWFRPTMIVVVCVCFGLPAALSVRAADEVAPDQTAEGGLQNGWQQVIEIPAFKTPSGEIVRRSAKLRLWVEQGWLSARRIDADGAVEWQVALAQPLKETVPVVDVDTATGGLDLSYGKYFIRENVGLLRVLRQRKIVDSPPWPKLSLTEPLPRNMGSAAWPNQSVEIKGWRHKDWCWAMSGLPGDQYDVWLRLEHKDLAKDTGNGFVSGFIGGPRPPRMFYGDKSAIDEGDLFYAVRSPAELAYKAVARKKLRQEFGKKPAPPIVASQWFNSPATSTLENFRGQVVLLDFWGTWCGPCVKSLPKVQALHEKYKDRGLIVIGVHSQEGAEDLPAFLKKQPLSFPIAIDTGETAQSYGIESWPAYFLIDKSGKSPGQSTGLPSAEQIERLLR